MIARDKLYKAVICYNYLKIYSQVFHNTSLTLSEKVSFDLQILAKEYSKMILHINCALHIDSSIVSYKFYPLLCIATDSYIVHVCVLACMCVCVHTLSQMVVYVDEQKLT